MFELMLLPELSWLDKVSGNLSFVEIMLLAALILLLGPSGLLIAWRNLRESKIRTITDLTVASMADLTSFREELLKRCDLLQSQLDSERGVRYGLLEQLSGTTAKLEELKRDYFRSLKFAGSLLSELKERGVEVEVWVDEYENLRENLIERES